MKAGSVNATKYVVSLPATSSDPGSTPGASTSYVVCFQWVTWRAFPRTIAWWLPRASSLLYRRLWKRDLLPSFFWGLLRGCSFVVTFPHFISTRRDPPTIRPDPPTWVPNIAAGIKHVQPHKNQPRAQKYLEERLNAPLEPLRGLHTAEGCVQGP